MIQWCVLQSLNLEIMKKNYHILYMLEFNLLDYIFYYFQNDISRHFINKKKKTNLKNSVPNAKFKFAVLNCNFRKQLMDANDFYLLILNTCICLKSILFLMIYIMMLMRNLYLKRIYRFFVSELSTSKDAEDKWNCSGL